VSQIVATNVCRRVRKKRRDEQGTCENVSGGQNFVFKSLRQIPSHKSAGRPGGNVSGGRNRLECPDQLLKIQYWQLVNADSMGNSRLAKGAQRIGNKVVITITAWLGFWRAGTRHAGARATDRLMPFSSRVTTIPRSTRRITKLRHWTWRSHPSPVGRSA
jgi:hypothetical protein